MTREGALQILREHEAEFKAKGVVHLRLFGSVARDEGHEESDVDILADFDPEHPLGKFRVGSLQQDLSRLLGRYVDLSSESWLKESIRERIIKESVSAF